MTVTPYDVRGVGGVQYESGMAHLPEPPDGLAGRHGLAELFGGDAFAVDRRELPSPPAE